MSIEDDLLRLAREREEGVERALAELLLEQPDHLRRQLRVYLSRQVDHGRMKRADERIPQLATVGKGLNELACPRAEFSSGAQLMFRIKLEKVQRGWLMRCFEFHLRLPQPRRIGMVSIHLNDEASYKPLLVPRCHIHIGDSEAHVPFPVMDPRLILHLICERVEPDFGV